MYRDSCDLFNGWFYDGKRLDEQERTRIRETFERGLGEGWVDERDARGIQHYLRRIDETAEMYRLLERHDS